MKNKIVMIFGTFDIFHQGHINFIKQAKRLGDYLVVVVARDKTVKKVKGNYPQNNESQRLDKIRKSGLASEVVLGDLVDKYKRIKEYRPQTVCLGYDQIFFINKLRDKLDEIGLLQTNIIKLNSYKPNIYKSSLLKNRK